MVRRYRLLLGTLLLGLLLAGPAHADKVVSRAGITSETIVRKAPTASSPSIGRLRPGEQAEYLGSVPRWHKIRLGSGQEGFVSKGRTEVVSDPVDPSAGSPFTIHFLDVGTGDAAIIDMGDREVVIDGGDAVNVLTVYAKRTKVIDGPIELLIVTHGDTDHWRGLRRLLGFDRVEDGPPSVLEFWEPGYDRACNPPDDSGRQGYLTFISNVQRIVPPAGFRRPLGQHHTPAVVSGRPEAFTIPSLPGITFTLLHSDANPSGADCSYRINNASIVLLVEIAGVRILFTGDANGKERDEASPGTPGHVEAKLLGLERAHPGTLKADILKVPHHGSETASTQTFIDAVDPRFVIISASTKHHLPRETVVERYRHPRRVILRTDVNRQSDRDHILCTKRAAELECNFADVLQE